MISYSLTSHDTTSTPPGPYLHTPPWLTLLVLVAENLLSTLDLTGDLRFIAIIAAGLKKERLDAE